MLVIVTDGQGLKAGKLNGTFYTIPENWHDAGLMGDYNNLINEAKATAKTNLYAAAALNRRALELLLVILENADHLNGDELLKPQYRFGRAYTLGMLGKLFRGALPRSLQAQFKEGALRRINTARYGMKKLHGVADTWAGRVKEGLAS